MQDIKLDVKQASTIVEPIFKTKYDIFGNDIDLPDSYM